jgi:hypothetical protein
VPPRLREQTGAGHPEVADGQAMATACDKNRRGHATAWPGGRLELCSGQFLVAALRNADPRSFLALARQLSLQLLGGGVARNKQVKCAVDPNQASHPLPDVVEHPQADLSRPELGHDL